MIGTILVCTSSGPLIAQMQNQMGIKIVHMQAVIHAAGTIALQHCVHVAGPIALQHCVHAAEPIALQHCVLYTTNMHIPHPIAASSS